MEVKSKLINKLFFSEKHLPDEERLRFRHDRTQWNTGALMGMSVMALAMQTINFVTMLIDSGYKCFNDRFFLFGYISLAVFSVVSVLVLKYLRGKPGMEKLKHLSVIIYMVIYSPIEFLLSMSEAHNSHYFINYMFFFLFVALIPRLRFREMLIFTVPYTSFNMFVFIREKLPIDKMQQAIFITVILFFISQMLYRTHLTAFLDRIQIQLAYEKLETLSKTDSLTGIWNRRALDSRLEEIWQKCVESDKFITIMVMDIDFFKDYNDTFGHITGDECLKEIANAITGKLPGNDEIFARFGGEEFTLVMSGLPKEETYQFALELNQVVHECKMQAGNTEVSQYVTISIGLATYKPKEILSTSSLFKLADRCLYEAKNKGRNLVIAQGISDTQIQQL